MTHRITPDAADRTRAILEDLEAVRENLLALSDDIWRSIDHNDPDALNEGVEFKRAFNAKSAAFDTAATALSALVQQYTRVNLDAGESTGTADRTTNDRIIAELNREEPHALDEDFTFKRPHGFILDGQATSGLTTWRRMFELICLHLYTRDTAKFVALPTNADYISSRGNPNFSTKEADLRSATLIAGGVFAEVNMSANMIRDQLLRLLATFGIPAANLRIYLRQDRDAGRATDGH